MDVTTTIELRKEDMKFSAAHFTIFSATERERLHGHDYRVGASITALVDDNGLSFPYQIFKQYLRTLCDELDEYTLIAARSPHLKIEDHGAFHDVHFAGQVIPLLKSDTLLLPIRNVTVEELSRYLLGKLVAMNALATGARIRSLTLSVYSGPGQSGSATWSAAA